MDNPNRGRPITGSDDRNTGANKSSRLEKEGDSVRSNPGNPKDAHSKDYRCAYCGNPIESKFTRICLACKTDQEKNRQAVPESKKKRKWGEAIAIILIGIIVWLALIELWRWLRQFPLFQ